ncbi:hypothetical protein KIN20_008265 [Parelaphostrongylus tenuis]|uniref:Uncharacterized protein n=1 Tax=Parelaphostrongylus tenuis TaxID=148309 RepID=A0AAD5QKJ5_PARTN|nr:hypothetical protein KIN20_008265 [Parelaphostrongylus tenuis]
MSMVSKWWTGGGYSWEKVGRIRKNINPSGQLSLHKPWKNDIMINEFQQRGEPENQLN